jgi:hypothetical protein
MTRVVRWSPGTEGVASQFGVLLRRAVFRAHRRERERTAAEPSRRMLAADGFGASCSPDPGNPAGDLLPTYGGFHSLA